MSNNDIRNFINSSSLGVYTKYVRVVNGTKYLIKSGRGDGKSKTSILEPVSECICYELAKQMGIDCAEYTLEGSGEELLSVSKWFYDDTKERFFSANKLMRILGISRENLYDNLISNIPNIKLNLNNMIVYDYIVNNTDRHLKNFGFLEVDNELRFAPIYDNGLALGAHIDDYELEAEDIEDLLLDSDYSKCFDTSNRKQLNLVDYYSLNLNIDYEIIVNKYSKYISKKRYEFIIALLKERIEVIKKCCSLNQK